MNHMKKPYSKPTITVEPLKLDQPICAGCNADQNDMKSLIELGYFGDIASCAEDKQVSDGTLPGYDTICYHSNVQTAFTS